MDYVLFIRRRDRDQAARDRVQTELQNRGTVEVAPLSWVASRPAGEVRIRPFPIDDPPAAAVPIRGPWGFDLSVPGSASHELASDFCQLAFALAEKGGMEVYDPQLGREMRTEEADVVVERIRKHSTYFTESVGLDHPSPTLDVVAPAFRLTGRAKLFLILGLSLVGLALLAQYCPL
jgi:hypothetical protein